MPDTQTTTPAAPTQPAATAPVQPPATFPRHNPDGEPAKTAPRPMHHRMALSERPNVWRWKAKDKFGNQMEFAPGCFTHIFRGPTTPKDAKASAELYLANARNEAMRAGYEDPGWTLDESTLEAVGTADPVTPDTLGNWKPDGAVPITVGVGKLEPRGQ